MNNRPNILLVMVDQLAAPAMPVYGHPVVQMPALTRLAEKSAVFESAYCNFPICAPSRFSLLSGQLPHAIDAFDNASEFPASVPTVAHYLTFLGYRTILCGKMHFVGPDQLHGFEERLMTDIYPSDFSWTPDYSKGPGYRPTGVGMRPIVEAGWCSRSLQMDYDEEVEWRALQRIYDLARAPQDQPFFLTVSFTHPHPPFVAPKADWDRYRDADIDAPRVPTLPFEELDEHSRWLYRAHGRDEYRVTEDDVRRARRAYYGMASYVDRKVGHVLAALDECGLAKDTMIVFTGDHGEMLGERGMWYKQTFFEWSVRVPLLISLPGQEATRRVAAPVSLVDLLPTLVDAAGARGTFDDAAWHGSSLMPHLDGTGPTAERDVIVEYSADGVSAPSRMVRSERYKYIYTFGLEPLLYDLVADPDERVNLAGRPEVKVVQSELHAKVVRDWDPAAVNARVLRSQRNRLFLAEVAQRSGRYPNWTFQPFVDESKRFIRGGGAAGPTAVKGRARIPFVAPKPPDNVTR